MRALDRARTVAILPVGALEAHGPHLPLATDVLIAAAMARRGAEILEGKGVATTVLPPLAYSVAPFAAGFPGTISLRPQTLTAVLSDVAGSLHRHGFGALALANAHLDPDHLEALHDAVAAAPFPVVFPDLTRKPWGTRLSDEFRSGACHAGRFEGSIVLAERPEWVRSEVAADLPARPESLSKALREGANSFEEAGLDRAYCGDPAAATAEEGKATVEALGGILADAVLETGLFGLGGS